MDRPLTDVKFVSSPQNCPNGYTLITKCPCGHDANLWVKFLGAKSEERYLCYTKEKREDGKIIEDMYIPGKGERYIIKGFEVIKKTVEGDDTLNHRFIAYKRTSPKRAQKAVYDISVFRSKDNPSSSFRKLGAKLNNLYICVREDSYTYKKPDPSSTSPPPSNAPPTSSPPSNVPPTVSPPSNAPLTAPPPSNAPPPSSITKAPSFDRPVKQTTPPSETRHVSPPPAPTGYNSYETQNEPVPSSQQRPSYDYTTSSTGYPPTTGYQAPPTTGYQAPPTTGYQAPPTSGYQAPPTTGYQAPPTTGYQAPPTTGYQAPPTTGHQAPPSTGYPHHSDSGYPVPSNTGYPAPPTSYPAPPTTGYSAPPTNYSAPPTTGYSAPPTGYSAPPTTSNYQGPSLGFDHLDMDQPIPDDWTWEEDDDEEDPTDSAPLIPPSSNQTAPVYEMATLEIAPTLNTAPLTLNTAPPTNTYSTQLGFGGIMTTPNQYPAPPTAPLTQGYHQPSYPQQPYGGPSAYPTQYGYPPSSQHSSGGYPPAQYGGYPSGGGHYNSGGSSPYPPAVQTNSYYSPRFPPHNLPPTSQHNYGGGGIGFNI